MTRIADDFDAIRRRLAELTKTTTSTPTQVTTSTQSAPACSACGTRMSDGRTAWVCPRCGSKLRIS